VRCPLCGEEVEVAALVTERRRRRRPSQPAAGHLPRRVARRALVRLVAVAAALALVAWLWSSWEPVSAWVADGARATLGRDKPR
jgi:ferric-dicitrate binding protein FerR (iron transport regulator)